MGRGVEVRPLEAPKQCFAPPANNPSQRHCSPHPTNTNTHTYFTLDTPLLTVVNYFEISWNYFHGSSCRYYQGVVITTPWYYYYIQMVVKKCYQLVIKDRKNHLLKTFFPSACPSGENDYVILFCVHCTAKVKANNLTSMQLITVWCL